MERRYSGIVHNSYEEPLIKSYLMNTMIVKEYKKFIQKGIRQDMSFVGIIVLENALLAFGDSRSTLVDGIGNRKIEEGRNVQKVFRINDDETCVFVTHGINKIKTKNKNIVNLEDFLNQSIENNKTMTEIIEGLTCNFEKNRKYYGDNSLYLTIGGKDDEGIFIRNIEISFNGVFFSHKERRGYSISSIDVYTPWFKGKFSNEMMMMKNPEGIKKMIEEELESEIRRCDEEYFVNPVGLPLQFEIIKF